ncbi:pathogenesis related protein-like protein [Nostoc sp. NIES-3756]|uniref:ester cyclase n=1 Tax=Nostoc sp. NIES-3756 TaxID=1751286 RepID=UPI000721DC61|nr:ester cyclase [Nostoc sp. NIES-3756]BAT54135.1 pathogenesis related protein-like protein [Nostoc sp. NIES-3756]
MSQIDIEKLHLWVQDRDTVLKYSTHVEWRYGEKPDYTHSNEKFAQESTRNHPANSLETLVQNLVRTFDIEANFKTNPNQWLSVVPDQFRMSTNGGSRYTITDLISSGTYKLMIGNTKNYKASEENFVTSTNLFHTAFPDGFLWEVLEVYSGPPNIVFKWRHWGQFTGAFKDYAPTGETIEVIGTSFVHVTDDLKILSLEHYYDNTNFLAKLTSGGKLVKTPENQQKKSTSIWRKLWNFISKLWRRKEKSTSANIQASRCPFAVVK